MLDSNIAIKVEGLSKRYYIGKEKDGSLRGTLSSLFQSSNQSKEEFWALKDVSFEVQKGDVVGIIGKNGAGKSTLLKILSQITKPTEGKISINGRIASLLEVGTGFHPELTGRENIYLNGTILGMTRKEVKEKFDEIVAFSGIEKFIDTPVKHYSSGQYVRLAFSVAAHLEPEILVIDEVLAVGDAEFQKKCLGKMKDVAGAGRTVLFVSHNMAAVQNLCTKGVLLKEGKVLEIGSIEKVIESYQSIKNDSYYQAYNSIRESSNIYIKKIQCQNNNNIDNYHFDVDEKIQIKFTFSNFSFERCKLFFTIKSILGEPIFSGEKLIDNETTTLSISEHFLTRGEYKLFAMIHIPQVAQYDKVEDALVFTIEDNTSPLAIHGGYNYGKVFGNFNWID